MLARAEGAGARGIRPARKQRLMGELEAATRRSSLRLPDGLPQDGIVGLPGTWSISSARTFTVVGKGDKARTLPMSQAIYDLLWRAGPSRDRGCHLLRPPQTTRRERRLATCTEVTGSTYESGLK